jgi:glycosyltransferase involved in cell wall biosynthesis
MLIFINARFLAQSITGPQRYALEVVKSLDQLIEKGNISSEYTFVLLAPNKINYKPNLKNIMIKQVGCFGGHFWEQFELPYYSRDGVLISLCNVSPIFKFNQIVTIHDAIIYRCPQAYSRSYRMWYKFILNILGKVSCKIITVSYFSKNDLIKYCGICEEKIDVNYLGKEHIMDISPDYSIIEELNLDKIPFLLAVSSMNPNKNFQSILQALKLIPEQNFQVVIAGGTNKKIFKNMQLDQSENVKFTGYVTDEQLRALYEKACCFIYPSFYEGFGLPPLEAMTCGCPVIVSNTGSLPEVYKDAAYYVDPYDSKSIADSINYVMNNEKVRVDLINKGIKRKELFKWDTTAQRIFNIIKEI